MDYDTSDDDKDSVTPVHLNCWPAKSSCILELFKLRTNQQRLRELSRKQMDPSQTDIFIGWSKLRCSERKQILTRVFSENSSHITTAHDVCSYFPCDQDQCGICFEPKWCSYDSCSAPDVSPQTCINCQSGLVHHVCQQKFDVANRLTDGNLICSSCAPQTTNTRSRVQTRSVTRGDTRTFTSLRRNVSTTHNSNHTPINPSEYFICIWINIGIFRLQSNLLTYLSFFSCK